MKKNILMRTNFLVCLIIVAGFLGTAVLSYRTNYSASLQSIEQVSDLTSEGIYYQMTSTFAKPVNVSLTMANDSLLRDFLSEEAGHLDDSDYTETLQGFLSGYRDKYGYDSVFLVSTATGRYYNFNGLDRVLTQGNPENDWYYNLLESGLDYSMNVDNDEVEGAQNEVTVFVNCQIKDHDGTVMGVVGVGLRIDNLQEMLLDYERDYGVGVYLIDEEGRIEISSRYSGYEQRSLFELRHYDARARQEVLGWRQEESPNRFWTSDLDGKPRSNYIVSRFLPELDWHLVVERDTAALVADLNRQMRLTVLIISVIVAGILVVITRVIRSFNRQIVALAQSIEQERRTIFEQATGQLFENIYELDITHNRAANEETERYFESLGAPAGTPFDKALQIIAQKQIKEEYREGYIGTFCPQNVIRAYESGEETLRYEFMITRDGLTYYWMRITARLVHLDSDNSLHMLTYRQNIEPEKQQEQRLQLLALTDEMTGLLTKSATQRRIEKLLYDRPGELFAFFIFDIDNFKQANDLFGHAFGDGVIKEFTQVIRSHFRSGDVLGRIGGDEFVAFLSIPEERFAADKVKALSRDLDRSYACGGKSWHISASIGVAFAPRDGRDFASLYQNADAALYQTKARGKNGFTLYESAH